MIRRVLAALLRPHNPFVNFVLPVGLAFLCCAALAGWSAERDARRDNDAAHANAVRQFASAKEILDANLQSISRAYLRITDSLAAAGDDVTATRVAYRTMRDTMLVDLQRVHSDTPKLLKDLPVFLRSSDAAIAACTEYQNACESFHHTADSLIAALRHKNDLLEHAPVWKPPRFGGEIDALYDPIAKVPATSAAVQLRVRGDWSAIARADYRATPGESPRLYVGARRAF